MINKKSNFAALNENSLRLDKRKEQVLSIGLSVPALLAIILIIFVPIGWLFSLSFINNVGEFSLENYQKMLEYKSYARVFVTTFKVSILSTMLCILIGYPLAYFLSQVSQRYSGFFLLAVLLPFWTSLLVRTYAWLVLLQRKGLINNFAIDMGFWELPLKLVHNLNGTLIGMVHIMLPYLVLPLYSTMKQIDKNAISAAANLGATPTQSFWLIFFPLSLPGVVAGGLIVFILCLGFYVTPVVLGGGRVIMVASQITAILENQFNWGAASALGVVLLFTTFLILVMLTRLFKLNKILFGNN